MKIAPHIPKDRYSVQSTIFSLTKDGNKYSVLYRPLQERRLTVEFATPAPVKRVTVNNQQTQFTPTPSGIRFTIEGKDINFEIESE